MKTPKTVVKPARLTNDMRLTFVSAVMADVPKIDHETRVRDAVNKAHAAALPHPVKKLLADPELAGFVGVRSETLNSTNGLPSNHYMSFQLAAPTDKWLEKVVADAAEPLLKEWRDETERLKELKTKLHAVANSCSTTTKLAEAFPEFARYLPQTEAEGTRNLPALTNVVADFVKAGWPKSKQARA